MFLCPFPSSLFRLSLALYHTTYRYAKMSVDDSVPAAGVLLALLAFFFSLLCLAPLVWHIKSRNLAASCLVGWVLISNFLCFIDVLIWPNDDFVGRFDGVGLCDIQVKLQVARSTALPAATLCIIKSLADVMNPNRINLVPSRAQRLRKSGLELALCVAVPILTMILHFIVQYGRYSIIGISGCNATYLKSWVTVVLLSLPPLLLSFWQSYYCCKLFVGYSCSITHEFRSDSISPSQASPNVFWSFTGIQDQ